jgi:hypothetical protein
VGKGKRADIYLEVRKRRGAYMSLTISNVLFVAHRLGVLY